MLSTSNDYFAAVGGDGGGATARRFGGGGLHGRVPEPDAEDAVPAQVGGARVPGGGVRAQDGRRHAHQHARPGARTAALGGAGARRRRQRAPGRAGRRGGGGGGGGGGSGPRRPRVAPAAHLRLRAPPCAALPRRQVQMVSCPNADCVVDDYMRL